MISVAASNVNVVVITGNLTRDPELRSTGSGMAVCELRVAVNSRRKDGSGNWVDKPNYFDVTVFGAQGENCATYLAKGRPVAVEGRLDWREWETKDGSGKRQAVEIIADSCSSSAAATAPASPAGQRRWLLGSHLRRPGRHVGLLESGGRRRRRGRRRHPVLAGRSPGPAGGRAAPGLRARALEP